MPAGAMRALEESIRYPIADGADHFFIDHGPRYHPFFSNLGEAFFLLALDGERCAGAAVGVRRVVDWCGRAVVSFYACDLKVAAPMHRGSGLGAPDGPPRPPRPGADPARRAAPGLEARPRRGDAGRARRRHAERPRALADAPPPPRRAAPALLHAS